jgi:hypothetical protein
MATEPRLLPIAPMKRINLTAAALALVVLASNLEVLANALFAVTLRTHENAATGGLGGNLFVVDEGTAVARIVAPLTLNGEPIGLRGIAIHPKTRAFYGITAGLSGYAPRSLVTINPATGNASLIGSLGYNGSDINFDKKGTLYIWLPDENQLGTLDLGTGAAKPIAESGITETIGGGFAIAQNGQALLSATSAAGTLDEVDVHTGRVNTGPHLRGAPFVSAISAMDFSPLGKLYAVNTNLGAPANSALVTIDPKTGAVTTVGPLPRDTTALAFGIESDSAKHSSVIPAWLLISLCIAAVLGMGVVAYLVLARRRS